ncbi:hypothetical protein BJY52DRAFT_1242446 [Lactarius psammicola]|nr:hypothetical protein BJY52DRAFT_1242446 [Lactarius psammicola]
MPPPEPLWLAKRTLATDLHLLVCFRISKSLTRIFVRMTSAMVAALIGWCVRNAWESSDSSKAWLSVHHTCASSHPCYADRLFTLINIRLHHEYHPSRALDHSGNIRSTSDREGVGAVVYEFMILSRRVIHELLINEYNPSKYRACVDHDTMPRHMPLLYFRFGCAVVPALAVTAGGRPFGATGGG